MKQLLLSALVSLSAQLALSTAAIAQPEPAPEPTPIPETTPVAAPTTVTTVVSPQVEVRAGNAAPSTLELEQQGWHRPVGKRLMHGIRIGYNRIWNYEKATRDDGMTSLKDEFGLKTPHSMVLGYEAFYRVVGHSWLNVLVVGNVSVAGLEQSKFIPAASGLIGAEIERSFQIGVGVNVTPDPESPTHMIAAVGWTPRAGSIYTPVHFYFIPDTEGNHRGGATVGVTW